MLFHEAAARSFADQGIDTIFGLIGDGNLYMMDSFQRAAGGTYYSFANEASGVLAASGYASTSGKLGVATAKRLPELPDVPTLIESGVPNFVAEAANCTMLPTTSWVDGAWMLTFATGPVAAGAGLLTFT